MIIISKTIMKRSVVKRNSVNAATQQPVQKPKLNIVNIPPLQKPKPIRRKPNKWEEESCKLRQALDRHLYKQYQFELAQEKKGLSEEDSPCKYLPSHISVMLQNVTNVTCKYCKSHNIHVQYADPVGGKPLKAYATCLECGSRFISERDSS